jgi:hypothetical protein
MSVANVNSRAQPKNIWIERKEEDEEQKRISDSHHFGRKHWIGAVAGMVSGSSSGKVTAFGSTTTVRNKRRHSWTAQQPTPGTITKRYEIDPASIAGKGIYPWKHGRQSG